MALYRKYRPSTFAEVVGQQHVTEPLSLALESRDSQGRPDRINHAYLFSGPRGCGKTSSARILARSLNCEHGPTPSPCGKCASCLALAAGGPGNLDVTELDAASHNGVEDMRDLRDTAIIQPAESRYRIFVIDEAHMITSAGFNALLKIVEEPPEHLIFIFATTEPERVLPTIRSRTHHYPFRLLTPNDMRGLLQSVVAHEGVHVADDVYPLVISAGGGSPRDSLSVLDQLVAGAGPDGVTYEVAAPLLGVTEETLLSESVDALASGDRAAIFDVIDRVVQSGQDPKRYAEDMLKRVRDLLVLSALPSAQEQGLVDVPADLVPVLIEQTKAVPVGTLTRFAQVLNDGLSRFRGATSPRLLLEVMCVRMLLPAAEDSVEALWQRVEALERGIPAGGGASAGASPAASQAAGFGAKEEPESSMPSMDDVPTVDENGRPLSALQRARLARQRQQGGAAETPKPAAQPAPEPVPTPEPKPAQPAQTAQSEQLRKLAEAREATKRMQELAREQERAERERMAMEREAATRRADAGEAAEIVTEAAAEVEAVAPVQPALTIDDIQETWSDILAATDGEHAMPVRVLAAQARPLSLDEANNLLVIAHHTGALANRLNAPEYAATLARAIQQHHHIDVRVQCQVGTRARDHQAPSTTPPDDEPSRTQPAATREVMPEGLRRQVEAVRKQAAAAEAQPEQNPMPAQSATPAQSAEKMPRYKQILERRRQQAEAERAQQEQSHEARLRKIAEAKARAGQPADDGVPLPPEPVDDVPPDDYGYEQPVAEPPVETSAGDEEAEMIAAAQNPGQLDHRDMKEVVMELLERELGAKPM
ncbi:DNA polymerase III subunit gamma and tau [Corynebacterium sp. H113]|uniref:DNA polymerase III subunit gamma and tau n=1 Tax=Corynebacterium sp. H113 TaxID=3133419 RepID=UPI0030AA79A4